MLYKYIYIYARFRAAEVLLHLQGIIAVPGYYCTTIHPCSTPRTLEDSSLLISLALSYRRDDDEAERLGDVFAEKVVGMIFKFTGP